MGTDVEKAKRVLVIGGGGREHALVRALKKSPVVESVYCCPGNAGIAQEAVVVTVALDTPRGFEELALWMQEHAIDLTVIGPEKYQEAGLVDYLEERGHLVFGTNRAASLLESSKQYAKEFMLRHQIPTAESACFEDLDALLSYLDRPETHYPIVLKADGLAAGKGVIIAEEKIEARKAASSLFQISPRVLAEEFLTGTEASIMCFVDRDTIRLMQPARDYKKAYDGDEGPNTGGMGSFSPDLFLPESICERFRLEVADRFMKGIREEAIDFRGVLFVGIMYDGDRLNVLEFNTRFGDPETEVTLPRIQNDLFEVLEAVAQNRLSEIELRWNEEFAVLVVLAAQDYPAASSKGARIAFRDGVQPDHTIHFGTTGNEGEYQTAGGRVLGAMGFGATLEDARQQAYANARDICFAGVRYRKDIAKMV
ncbi:MAG: phosphoribosylamine--glycine ligase [Bacillota bacterium]|nr:phosphoribosylamine--glycine ligase [Bacillota bacterium]